MKKVFWSLFFVMVFAGWASAHPMPGSVVRLSVLDDRIRGEAAIPLVELGNAVGDQRLENINDLFFKTYFLQHIRAFSEGKQWQTEIENIAWKVDRDSVVGKYKELNVIFTLVPPNPQVLRKFTFQYDAVMHQVITHSALVYITQDWDNGIQPEGEAQQAGIIKLDIPSGKIIPLTVDLQEGSWFTGFKSMFFSGLEHIREGTDHLLFIVVLLLPSMLLVSQKQWRTFGGIRYSLVRLLKIVTAFTLGHSFTLLLGAFNWVLLPSQPVEVLIAFSILVSAIHAIKPIFPGREAFIAAGFGLIHGLAFASVLSHLDLGAGKMVLSILGFNLGIEAMQLFVIGLIFPWLILLNKTTLYKGFRVIAASLAAIASLGWMAERVLEKENATTAIMNRMSEHGFTVIVILGLFSVLTYVVQTYILKNKAQYH